MLLLRIITTMLPLEEVDSMLLLKEILDSMPLPPEMEDSMPLLKETQGLMPLPGEEVDLMPPLKITIMGLIRLLEKILLNYKKVSNVYCITNLEIEIFIYI
mmetsp:Transcript_10899/g.1691  ORF Transcript_10899/g.1691 Transcript_10899/m.1691 type:complete len:101 (+) Transcript_10899:98-400(+)